MTQRFVYNSRLLLFHHIAPDLVNKTPTVLTRMRRSSQILQCSIYSVSNFTTSSKSVILLLPLTCHMPVIPGLKARRARWWYLYFLHSSTVGGRVPTKLIWFSNTLKNCGNSSRLWLRMNSPMPVFFVPSGRTSFPIMRGSKSSLNIMPSETRFSFIYSFFRSSASMYMDRIL